MSNKDLRQQTLQALEWESARSSGDIIKYRSSVIASLASIKCEQTEDDWHRSSDPKIQKMVRSRINGPLLQELARQTNFCDPECIEMFRTGPMSHLFLPYLWLTRLRDFVGGQVLLSWGNWSTKARAPASNMIR